MEFSKKKDRERGEREKEKKTKGEGKRETCPLRLTRSLRFCARAALLAAFATSSGAEAEGSGAGAAAADVEGFERMVSSSTIASANASSSPPPRIAPFLAFFLLLNPSQFAVQSGVSRKEAVKYPLKASKCKESESWRRIPK